MATVNDFKELKIWQQARDLNQEVFESILKNHDINDLALKDQLNRSCASIMDNIAEGFGRGGNKEFVNFLSYSLGSLCEVESQLIRASDRIYVTDEISGKMREDIKILKGMLISFINYLKKSNTRGPKFKVEEPGPFYGKYAE